MQPDGSLGLFAMHPDRYHELVKRLIQPSRHLRDKVLSILMTDLMPPADALAWNLKLSAVMARLAYCRVKEPMPAPDDITGLSQYYQRHGGHRSAEAWLQGFTACLGAFPT